MKTKTAQQLINEVCNEIKHKEELRFHKDKKFWKDVMTKFDKELEVESKSPKWLKHVRFGI